MSEINKVMLVARVGAAPELKETKNGKKVANFSVATNLIRKDSTGHTWKEPEWHRITVWGENAEVAVKNLQKGDLVFVEGRLQYSEWEKDEQKHKSAYVNASRCFIINVPKGREKRV